MTPLGRSWAAKPPAGRELPGLSWDSQGICRQWCRMDIKCGYASLCVSLFLVSSNIWVALLVSMWTCGQEPRQGQATASPTALPVPESQLQTPRATPTPKLTDKPAPLPCEGQTELLSSQKTKRLKQTVGQMLQKSSTAGKISNLHILSRIYSLSQSTQVFLKLTDIACQRLHQQHSYSPAQIFWQTPVHPHF